MKKYLLIILCLSYLSLSAQTITIDSLGAGTNTINKNINGLITRHYTDTIDNILYAVGGFSYSGGKKVYGVAKWDGQTWDSLGSGIRRNLTRDEIDNVIDVIRFQNEIYIGGAFDKCGGKDINSFARWNGVEWNEVGGGIIDTSDFGIEQFGVIADMEVYNNELYIIGNFKKVGNVLSKGIAKWDGQNWTDLSQGYTYPYPTNAKMTIMFYNGELYLAGNGMAGLLKRVGNTWVKVGPGVKGDAWINRLEVYQNKLYAAGYFHTYSGNIDNSFFYTNGTSYFGTAGGVLPSNLFNMQDYKGELYVCGQINFAGFQPVGRIAKWNGSQWFNTGLSILDPPNNPAGTLRDMEVYNGKLIVAGQFTQINSTQVFGIASIDFGTSGIQNLKPNSIFKIYPNPTNTTFTVQAKDFAQLESILVYNALGKLVLTQKAEIENMIDVSGFSKGLYMVEVRTDKGVAREKLMVE